MMGRQRGVGRVPAGMRRRNNGRRMVAGVTEPPFPPSHTAAPSHERRLFFLRSLFVTETRRHGGVKCMGHGNFAKSIEKSGPVGAPVGDTNGGGWLLDFFGIFGDGVWSAVGSGLSRSGRDPSGSIC